jgi:hypothetical protein
MILKRLASALVIFGGVIWLIAGVKALKHAHGDALPCVISGFILMVSGVLFAQFDNKL